ncbi:MAG: M55 family metallopeptidase [Desulfurococcaceae archaeon]
MKAYVSLDIEGLPGLASITMLTPGSSQFNIGSRLITIFAKKTAEYLFENGFDKVVIADSHGYMTNIDYMEMPRNVSLIQGYPRPFSMVYGVDKSFDVVVFIGYHSGAGTVHGFLDHTYSGRVFHEIIVNDLRMSEYLLNSLYVGEIGLPVILLAGDEHLRNEVIEYTPWTVFIDFKKGITRYSAEYDNLEDVLDRFKRGLQIAVSRFKRGETKPFTIEKPYRVSVVLRDTLLADIAENIEGFSRKNAYTIFFETNSVKTILSRLMELSYIGMGIEYLREHVK